MGESAASTAAPSRGLLVGMRSSILSTSSASSGAPGTSSFRTVVGSADHLPCPSGNGYSPVSIR